MTSAPARSDRVSERRKLILCSARSLFACRGFDATIADIARCSGLGVQQIYRDFNSKEKIVAAIARQELLGVVVRAKLDTEAGRVDATVIHSWIERVITLADGPDEDTRRLIAVIIAESVRNPCIAEILCGCQEHIRKNVAASLDYVLVDHGPDHREMLTDMVMAVSAGVFQLRVQQKDYHSDLQGAFVKILLTEIRRAPPKS